jgi:hypothetical protein
MERAGLPNVSPEFRSALQSMGSVPWTYTLEIASAVAVASATVCNTPEHVETIFFILLRNQLQAMSEGHHNVTLTQGIEQLRDTVLSLGEIQETIARIAKELILPVWGHSLKDPQTLKQLSAPQCEQIQGAAYRFAAELAIADRPIKALRKINNAMHHPNSLLPADIRPYMDKEEWEPLFEDCVTLSNGFSIVALKSQAELVEEGERLSHCVGNGSYAASCSQGLSQILSLRRDKKAIATIEVGVTQLEGLFSTQKSTSWEVCQFKGIENCKPDAQATAAFDEFVGLVAAGKVECTSGTRGSSFLPDSLLKTVSPFERMVGIPADELDVVDRILSHYESRARNFTFQLIPDRETLVRDISSAIRL